MSRRKESIINPVFLFCMTVSGTILVIFADIVWDYIKYAFKL